MSRAPSSLLQDRLVSSIRPLHKLTHLRVVVGGDASTHSVYWDDDSVKPIVACAQEYVSGFLEDEFDFGGTAAALVSGLPCREYLFVETYGYLPCEERTYYLYWRAVRGWRVEQRGTTEHEPVFVGLHEDVAETIIRQEELAINADDDDETFSTTFPRR